MRYDSDYWDDVDRVLKNVPEIEKLNGQSVFLTGATGMIGSAVAELLLRIKKRAVNCDLYFGGRDRGRTISRFAAFEEGKDYHYVPYILEHPNVDLTGLDYIIHTAGLANPGVYLSKPVETMLGNLLGLNGLLDAARRMEPKMFLYLSSSEVYGNRAKGENQNPYTEEDYGYLDVLNERACYPSSKRAAETLGVSYSKEYGVPFVSVRPGHIYGPSITTSDNRATAQFTRCAATGQDILMKSAGLQLRSYCYTLDCASAILTVLLNGKSGEAYNISNKDSVVSIRQIAEAFADETGGKVVFESASDEEIRSYNLMSNSSLNAKKIEDLGWKACFGLAEGVKRTLRYYE